MGLRQSRSAYSLALDLPRPLLLIRASRTPASALLAIQKRIIVATTRPPPNRRGRRICLLERLDAAPALPPRLPGQPLVIILIDIQVLATLRVLVVGRRDLVPPLLGDGILDEGVDDPVLQGVHDEGEDEHDEGDLQGRVAFGPAEGPVANPRQERQGEKEEEDEELHAGQADAVDEELLEVPLDLGGGAVVAGFDGFGWVGEGCAEEEVVEGFEDEVEDGDADGGLKSSA